VETLVEKVRDVGETIAREKGGVTLLALFQRPETLGRWDFIFAAPWIRHGSETLDIPYLVERLQATLKRKEMASIASIVPLPSTVPFVRTIQGMVGEVDGLKEIPSFDFDGMMLQQGFVLISRPERPVTPRVEAAAAAT
jgi:hypothetical protein